MEMPHSVVLSGGFALERLVAPSWLTGVCFRTLARLWVRGEEAIKPKAHQSFFAKKERASALDAPSVDSSFSLALLIHKASL